MENMSNVYYQKIDGRTSTEEIQKITYNLLNLLTEKEKVELEKNVPLKVHFGEKGNVTFLKSENYQGVIDFLKEKKIESSYIETSVLYGGKRYKKELHEQTAKEHGFTELPVIFADGDHGENFAEVEINKKHFKTFKIGKDFLDYKQLIVLAHFKGHRMAGFGGAMKQLSMGCAAKGGKMAMHMGENPQIISRKCKQCNLCKSKCNEEALHIGEIKKGRASKKRSWIDKKKCVGCGACVAICPYQAVSILSLKSIIKFLGIGNPFLEKVIEGAYAAQKDKNNIYINYAMNITPGCDCEGKKMKTLMDDFGVFISTDPVAIDRACYDMTKERGRTFKGFKQFAYAENIGLGTNQYKLIEIGA